MILATLTLLLALMYEGDRAKALFCTIGFPRYGNFLLYYFPAESACETLPPIRCDGLAKVTYNHWTRLLFNVRARVCERYSGQCSFG